MDEKIFTDLIYSGLNHIDKLKNLFPSLEYEDADDGYHEGRIEVSIPNVSESEYYRLIFLNGFSNLSFTFQLKLHGDKEWRDELIKNIELWKIEFPEYFKKE